MLFFALLWCLAVKKKEIMYLLNFGENTS